MTCTHVASARVEAASRREETTAGPMMAVMTAQQARLPFARVLTRRDFGPMTASLPARCAGTPRRWTTPVPRRPGIVRGLLGVIMSFAAFVIKLAREDSVGARYLMVHKVIILVLGSKAIENTLSLI